MASHQRTMPTRRAKKATQQSEETIDLHNVPSDEDVPKASGNVAKKKYNEMARKANKWRATMIELRNYNEHLRKENEDLKEELEEVEANDDASATTKAELNKELADSTKEMAKTIIWRTHMLIFSDTHAKDLTTKLLNYVVLLDNVGRKEYVEKYYGCLKQGIADGRQYCQSQLAKKTKGTSFFECRFDIFRYVTCDIFL